MEVIDYTLPHPAFALAFSSTHPSSSASLPSETKLAVGSFETRGENKVTILKPIDEATLAPVATATHAYPCIKVGFAPLTLRQKLGHGHDLLATSSDSLRLWDCNDQDPSNSMLSLRANLTNPAKSDYTAPLTSFAWSTVEPSLILTSSTNTTVTLWDIVAQVAVTQLIAHDREVYDVAWQPASNSSSAPASTGRDIFASCGADGSVRMFDIRSLEHSTILYEATSSITSPKLSSSTSHSQTQTTATTPSPLLKIAFDPNNAASLAVVHDLSSSVLLIDVRQPGIPVCEFKAHKAPINGFAWCSSTSATNDRSSTLATVSDDGLALIWDSTSAFNGSIGTLPSGQAKQTSTPGGGGNKKGSGNAVQTRMVRDPMACYEAGGEINSLAFGAEGWLACTVGKSIRVLRV